MFGSWLSKVLFPITICTLIGGLSLQDAFARSLQIDDLTREREQSSILRSLQLDAFKDPELLQLFKDASSALREERYEDAEAAALSLTEKAPDAPQGWHMLGMARVKNGSTSGALHALDAAAARYKNNSDPLVIKGDVLRGLGRFDDAEAAYRRAVEINPDDLRGVEGLGAMLEAGGKADEAITVYQSALATNPSDIAFALNTARLQVALDDLSAARETLKRFEASNPENSQVKIALGRVEFLSGNNEAATAYFDQAIRIAPENSTQYLLKARAQLNATEFAAAEETLRGAREIFPDDPQVPFELASLYGVTRDYARAAEVFEAGAERWPDIMGFHSGLLRASYRLNDFDAALSAARVLSSQPGASAVDHIWHALVLERLERVDSAITSYDTALELDPTNWLAANNLANLLFDRAPDRALELARLAHRTASENISVNRTLAWAEFSAGNTEAALALYDSLTPEASDDPIQLFRHGQVLIEAEEAEAGRILIQKALALDAEFRGAEDARKLLAE
ncbi:tetratricopeptide TPR_2 repeat protein [Dinoroseobacter shibae DFL 12 = DSM 16493]|jgi:tetratricopeptide (TPR) repeat protein|uniref:Tetratricopeptide TPR_2 repeat protein n=1 Tax=Dinoroseobacter shibae (strain DSM 16493 / NCIMB 14021 / DFL 12) TaxID=398580 RepID=A8LIW2_DINSH|nr:tetratricopeptide repeat protein [Dinoroseobacter shibae]ABV93076.1 tetratricopeptide TPR_2 repeat protein [Dinoroseobacter shibae DFL 12 = DSM 16493]URF48007.1 tetratricopeptide repeat protein [Dinoroseobacter shibae]URF52316.1 tetratricopeptide repeat protein [Dinoroseobacter shibae]